MIRHLYTVQSDHRDNFSIHLVPRIVTVVLLIVFLMPYMTASYKISHMNFYMQTSARGK